MKKILILTILAIGLVFTLLSPYLVKAEGNATAVLSLQEAEYTVGDPIQLHLEVTHPANQYVILPKLDSDW